MLSKRRKDRIKRVVERRQQGVTVVLEDMYDPHNAAAVLRTCDAFGIQDVHFIFKHQKAFNPRKIGKVSSSSANKWLDFHIHTEPQTCVEILKKQGFCMYATRIDEHAQSVFETDFHEKQVALVFGNEHRGLSEELTHLCDKTLFIPMRGFVESLNLSVTAGILLFELTRQRIKQNTLTALPKHQQSLLEESFQNR